MILTDIIRTAGQSSWTSIGFNAGVKRYAKRGLKRVERRARVALRTGGPDLRIALNGTDRGSRLMVLGRLEAETEDDFVRVEFWQVVERLLGRVMIGGCLLESRNAR